MAELCHFRFVTMTTIYIRALITESTFVVHLQVNDLFVYMLKP